MHLFQTLQLSFTFKFYLVDPSLFRRCFGVGSLVLRFRFLSLAFGVVGKYGSAPRYLVFADQDLYCSSLGPLAVSFGVPLELRFRLRSWPYGWWYLRSSSDFHLRI